MDGQRHPKSKTQPSFHLLDVVFTLDRSQKAQDRGEGKPALRSAPWPAVCTGIACEDGLLAKRPANYYPALDTLSFLPHLAGHAPKLSLGSGQK